LMSVKSIPDSEVRRMLAICKRLADALAISGDARLARRLRSHGAFLSQQAECVDDLNRMLCELRKSIGFNSEYKSRLVAISDV
jgi:thiamine monophosphate synthase